MRIATIALVAAVSVLAACGDPAPDEAPGPEPDASPDPQPEPEPNNGPPDPQTFPVDGCDPLMADYCALPFPSNLYLVEDGARETGFRLEFGAESLPANREGVHADPTSMVQMDGYGVGVPIVVFFPGLDASPLPGEQDIVSSLEEDAPIVLLEVDGEEVRRVPYWAEIDLQEEAPSKRALTVRPAEILKEGTRYVVAFRGLVREDGSPIEASPAFAALRDGQADLYDALRPRAERFESLFGVLEGAGVGRESLVLAWDFVTASCEALHGKMLQMRDKGLRALEEEGYEMVFDEVIELSPGQDANIAVEIRGTFRVPDFTRPVEVGVETGYRINEDEAGSVVQKGWRSEPFTIRVPRSAMDGTPHGLVNYGHGLNGSHSQVVGGFNSAVANRDHLIFFSTNMRGMSSPDVPVILNIIPDLSNFAALPDHLHQGLFNYIALTRTMIRHFPTMPEVQALGIVVDPEGVYYSGISQGGIYGASFVALSPDTDRGHLGVPGQNYSIMLHRSVDFIPFLLPLEVFYPDSVDRLIGLGALQTLWDRVDPSSYYRHISESPFEGNPSQSVLLASATGDYQVPLLTNEITARSGLGIAIMAGYGKDVPGVEPAQYPRSGSGVVNYSFGNPWPAPGNLPPDDDLGDPHGKPRGLEHHQRQMVHFFRTGEIIDVCGGDGCAPD